MKILWFSLSPCGSMRRNGNKRVIQGWLISLEDEIKKHANIDLHVCYFSDVDEVSFQYDGVTYHPVYVNSGKNGIERILYRYKSFESKDRKILPRMLEVVNRVHPDLIHIHGTEERFGLIQDYVHDIPIVFSIQGLIAPYKEKYFSGLPNKEIYQFVGLEDKLKHVTYRNEYQVFAKRAVRECHYLCKSKYVFGRTAWDEYITGMLNGNRKYFVVDEILRPIFYKKQWNKEFNSEGKIKIASTISGGIYKGYETALKTAFLLKQYAHIEFEWYIAGYNNHNRWVNITEQYTNINHEDVNVKLLGLIDADQLADLLTNADVYVHVSHIENSPNSVCEAMMLGMPIVSSFAGGTASLLTSKQDGILVQDGDPYAYAGAIVHLYNNYELAKQMGISAREKALVRHNPNRIIHQLVDAYNTILKDYK